MIRETHWYNGVELSEREEGRIHKSDNENIAAR
jgi:hypothetical protein